MSEHTPFNWMEHLGFEVQEAGGVPVINEEGDMREADLCHRVLWDEMVSIHAERDSLRAVNAELLEALNYTVGCSSPMTPQQYECWRAMHAAIASARKQGEQG